MQSPLAKMQCCVQESHMLISHRDSRLTHADALRVAVECGNIQATRELSAHVEELDPDDVKYFRDALSGNYRNKKKVAQAWLIACGEWAQSSSSASRQTADMRVAVLIAGRGVPLLISWAAVTALASNLDPEAKEDLTDLILNLKKGIATRWGISAQQWVNIDAWKTKVRGAMNNKRQYEAAPGSTDASRSKKARHAREIESVTLEGSELRV